MMEPKFKVGEMVHDVRLNRTGRVVESRFDEDRRMYYYRIDEPMAMPIHREDWLVKLKDVENNEEM